MRWLDPDMELAVPAEKEVPVGVVIAHGHRLFPSFPYLNQRKSPKTVGDTLMFSTHQTILAALYKDRLDAEWSYREEGDVDRVEAVNALWQFDYDEMGKASHDYEKVWDATFYGAALDDWSHFDRDSLTRYRTSGTRWPRSSTPRPRRSTATACAGAPRGSGAAVSGHSPLEAIASNAASSNAAFCIALRNSSSTVSLALPPVRSPMA
jgi:hypothetical protein